MKDKQNTKKTRKVLCTILSICMIVAMLTGCMQEMSTVKFDSTGGGTIKSEVYVLKELLANSDADMEDFTLSKMEDGHEYVGCEITQNFNNIDMLYRMLSSNESGLIDDVSISKQDNSNVVKISITLASNNDIYDSDMSDTTDYSTSTDESLSPELEAGLNDAMTSALGAMIKGTLDFTFDGKITSVKGNKDLISTSEDKKSVHLILVPQDEAETFEIVGTLGDENVKASTNAEMQKKFISTREYKPGKFTDVKSGTWYEKSLAKAYETGIISGTSDNTFNPNGNLTIASAIAMAARVHSIYVQDNYKFTKTSDTDRWYTPYVDYAIENGILLYDDYAEMMDDLANRYDMAYIFSNALPDNEYAVINSNVKINDVDKDLEVYQAISKLYKSGICLGDTNGNFNSDKNISRAEAAVIISRVAFPDTRVHLDKN